MATTSLGIDLSPSKCLLSPMQCSTFWSGWYKGYPQREGWSSSVPCLHPYISLHTMSSISSAPTSTSPNAQLAGIMQQKQELLFWSATKFAVVGASRDDSKWGAKALKSLVDRHMKVVPINPNATEVQGITCLKSLSDLPEPTKTSIDIVTPPKVTLDILRQAKSLGIFSIWLQPGAEDVTVVQFIKDSQLEDRCIYTTPPPASTPQSSSKAEFVDFQVLIGGPCQAGRSITDPPVSLIQRSLPQVPPASGASLGTTQAVMPSTVGPLDLFVNPALDSNSTTRSNTPLLTPPSSPISLEADRKSNSLHYPCIIADGPRINSGTEEDVDDIPGMA